jgi:hypothetical protein
MMNAMLEFESMGIFSPDMVMMVKDIPGKAEGATCPGKKKGKRGSEKPPRPCSGKS